MGLLAYCEASYLTQFLKEIIMNKAEEQKKRADAVSRKYKEKGDCTVIALSTACHIPYAQAHNICKNKYNRPNKKGMMTLEYHKLLDDYCELVHNRDCIGYVVKGSNRRQHKDEEWRLLGLPLTVNQFCKKLKTGRYLVSVDCHALAIIDGVPQDYLKVNSRVRIQAYGRIKEEKIYKG
jgi:hypothetical protein